MLFKLSLATNTYIEILTHYTTLYESDMRTYNILDSAYVHRNPKYRPGNISCRSRDTRVTRNRYEYSCSLLSNYSHAMLELTIALRRRFGSITPHILRSCTVLALIPSRHGNAIGVTTALSIFRQYPFGRCVHRRGVSGRSVFAMRRSHPPSLPD